MHQCDLINFVLVSLLLTLNITQTLQIKIKIFWHGSNLFIPNYNLNIAVCPELSQRF